MVVKLSDVSSNVSSHPETYIKLLWDFICANTNFSVDIVLSMYNFESVLLWP